MISGRTTLIAHIGYPTEAFKAPMIYNPFFEKAGIDAVVMPMGVKADDYPSFLRELFKVTNIRGALVTMPHKKTTIELADEVSPTARIAGAANALLKREDGSLLADMFDGEGFVRGVSRKGRKLNDASALVIGSGGVGSAIAASLAAAGVTRMGLVDAVAERGRIARQPAVRALLRTRCEDRFCRSHRLRPRRERDAPRYERGRPTADRHEPGRPDHVRRRGRDENGDHAVPEGGTGARLRHAGRYRYVVRADPGVPGVLRIRHGDTR